jgi:hypothetical protein
MNRNYRKPRIHVVSLTSILLKGFLGPLMDADARYGHWF